MYQQMYQNFNKIQLNSVDIFHIVVLREDWVLMESRIRAKPELGGVRIVALFISSHEQTK